MTTRAQSSDPRAIKARAAILDASFKLISRRAVDTISVHDITENAKVGPATFYRHFRDRDDAVYHAVMRSFGSSLDSVEIASRSEAVDRVLQLMRFAFENANLMRNIRPSKTYELVLEAYREALRGPGGKMIEYEILTWGVEDDPALPHVIMEMMLGGLMGLIQRRLSAEAPLDEDHVVLRALRTALEATGGHRPAGLPALTWPASAN
ncbi:TetR/AcrR family transcriptional regulator [Segniliparus rugosus]|uniref:HTH tetR-type domain-containing protein n=1 Tax=Segniliparus rugosus (strain ATCC BAA-974 / DSM 45345 / CCUG 50838 / CIP 108380 / JCM 13579 / CDC 945) TaxID=679197 RepID=E5XNJ8_SEGRC|nr:TetR/AcrR family transcriptional regulator [Segniliparus rugosus]EFV14110.1 hypothetical protein HMPREF9336_01027 [Segniliparus rugosus ATCC BAA-974]